MKKFFVVVIVLLIVLSVVSPVLAHSGGTDSDGGHTDNSTCEYHYHHGYSAHDHFDINGDGVEDCPYSPEYETDLDSSDSDKTLHELFQEAYRNLNDPTYQKGFDSGYAVGIRDGEKIGYKNGHIIGNSKGSTASYNKGYEEGYAVGYNATLSIVPDWCWVILALFAAISIILILRLCTYRNQRKKFFAEIQRILDTPTDKEEPNADL